MILSDSELTSARDILDALSANNDFQLSANARNTLSDASDVLAYLVRQKDFRAAVIVQ